MKKTLLFNSTSTEKRAALLEDDKLVELVVERPDQYRILGNIYRGRVYSILPGIQSAFVDLGIDKSAFLHASDVDPSLLLEKDDDRIEHYTNRGTKSKRRQIARVPIEQVLEEGQDVLVQITKESIGNKSPKVTTQISLAGRFIVLVPDSDFIGVSKKSSDFKSRRGLKKLVSQIKPEGIGIIVRTIGLKLSEDELIKEMKSLIEQWRQTQQKAFSGDGPKLLHKECNITTQVIRDLFTREVSNVYVDQKDDYDEIVAYLNTVSPELCKRVILYKEKTPVFDKFNIEKDIERSLKRKVWIKNGGYLFFDHAEALLAIDVNTGRNVGKNDLEETILKTNMASAYEICRQLRLRDIGGLIVVDFIDMRKPENRRKVENEMRKLLNKDPTTTSFTGLSKFGLMEITRKRVRPELQELFTNVCPACNGLGRIYSPATVAARIDRWLSRAVYMKVPKNLVLSVSPTLSEYIREDDDKILNELNKSYSIQLDIIINETLDQDEFEFYEKGSDKIITEEYS